MAKYLIPSFSIQPFGATDTDFSLHTECWYFGVDVPGGKLAVGFDIPVLTTDTPVQILAKVIDVVVAQGLVKGLIVARTDGLIPSYLRGI